MGKKDENLAHLGKQIFFTCVFAYSPLTTQPMRRRYETSDLVHKTKDYKSCFLQ